MYGAMLRLLTATGVCVLTLVSVTTTFAYPPQCKLDGLVKDGLPAICNKSEVDVPRRCDSAISPPSSNFVRKLFSCIYMLVIITIARADNGTVFEILTNAPSVVCLLSRIDR